MPSSACRAVRYSMLSSRMPCPTTVGGVSGKSSFTDLSGPRTCHLCIRMCAPRSPLDPPQPRQRFVLPGPIAVKDQHRKAPLAFLFRADMTDNAVNGEGIAPLVEALNNNDAPAG